MASTRNPTTDPGQPLVYQIRLKGHLGSHWSDWFEGLTITLEANGEMLLTGPVSDQAALHGVLRKVRDLGMPLLSVVCVTPGQSEGCSVQVEYKDRSRKETHMKAMLYTHYGSPDALQLTEVEKPGPKEGELLVKIHAAALNALDGHRLRAPLLVRLLAGNGLLKPKDPRLGVDIAGRVEAVGANVTQFQIGDEVYGIASGAFAEYACADETEIALKPANLSFEAAAAVPIAAITALHGLRHGQLQPGQQVLIYGASGGVGTFAVQIAKALGAEVTAVCSPRNVDQARSIGADHVLDYTQADVTRTGQRYDLILGVNGYHSIFAYRRALRPTGRYIFVGAAKARVLRAFLQAMLLGPVLSKMGSKKMGLFIAKITQQDLVVMKELLEAGKVVPVIEKGYPLSETAEALRYLEEGHAQGKIIITMN